MAVLTAQDYVERANSLSLYQFQDKEVIQGLLQSWSEQLQTSEDTAILFHLISIYSAVGLQLDELYGELFNLPRRGRTDEQYRSAILAKISTSGSDGTTERFLQDLRTITGSDDYVKFFEHYPADVHAWLGDGYSMYTYPEVEDLVQAGVNLRLIVDDEFDSFVMSEIVEDEADLQVTEGGIDYDLQVTVDGIDYDLQVFTQAEASEDNSKAILPEVQDNEKGVEYVPLAELLYTDVRSSSDYIIDDENNLLVDDAGNTLIWIDYSF